MIKLNNKNITYVALADTNNSLKAPKEIWYADSNNSVKLVYRRKDALIEGEDYEKYHWLVADIPDNKRCIDLPINSDEISYSMLIQKAGNITFFETISNYRYYTTYGTIPSIKVWNITTSSDVSTFNVGLQTNKVFNITSNESSLTINGVEVQKIGFPISAVVLRSGATLGNAITETSSILVNGVERYIPCKLLKSVPKWLDANGIRRQVGECGMIDLVSGKFYGNVNSVGTFTVENYYERKEWLKGDGTAYIDTDIIVDVPSLYISTSFTKKVGNLTPLFGSRNYVTSNGSQIWYLPSGQLRLDIITNGTNWVTFGSWNIRNINQLIVNCPNNVVNINGTDISSEVTYLSIKNSIYTFKIFSLECLNDVGSDANVPYHGAFGNFILNDSTHSLNLIPCTLTMDLPASMDANNIARTKGTSGMWDLVSDRFYGNVANSGTFKAVNLAEGVDYEVHQWLVGDEAAYIELDNQFNTDGNAFIDAHFKQYAQRSNGYNIIIGNNQSVDGYCIRITFAWFIFYDLHKVVNGVANSYRLTKTRDDMEHNVYMSFSSIEIDGVESTIVWGNQFDSSMRNKFTRIYTGDAQYGEITMRSNNKEFHLIPVKLLRPIPSKYDANGIARQAGECGMYDTLNDVFYGNVASSGSFTVSDDN